ncbi:MAG: DUF4301 family protein [Acidobacteriota bacterium]
MAETPKRPDAPWTESDRELFRRHGIALEEAQRQLELLHNPPPPAQLDRPAVPGDGVLQIPSGDEERLITGFEAASTAGRVTKMVPASGAATRMFARLSPYLNRPADAHRETIAARAAEGEPEASDLLELCQQIDRFAFRRDLDSALAATGAPLAATLEAGDYGRVLRALLSLEAGDAAEQAVVENAGEAQQSGGLDYLRRPKGLIPFHEAAQGDARTAFEEHFHEALAYARDSEGLCRLHFTVSPEHRERFQRQGEEVAQRLQSQARFEISYSVQDPATDTVALGEHGEPFRDRDENLLLRPGGHGSLIGNLERLLGDVVFIKNIDNVVPDHRKEATLRWKRILGGYLVELQERIFSLLRSLDDPYQNSDSAVDAAAQFLIEHLAIRPEDIPRGMDRSGWIFSRLHRPLRICGVVVNRGEPGGGPFWVRDAKGERSLQIVEASQIDSSDSTQRKILAGSTHFNPVDLVCGVRDFRGHPFQLSRYVDPATAFVANKNFRGRPLKALEHPGLWNGAMARWNTLFVEVPAETFAPVKTVFDLLRPEHQGAD